MPAFTASAPGKAILFGEHAVVYGRPAIAVPVMQLKARAIVTFDPRYTPGQVMISAPGINLEATLADLPEEHPIAAVIRKAATVMKLNRIPTCRIQVTSTIPIAGGLGSSAAVSVAILRAFSAAVGHPLTDEQVSSLAFEIEVIHHGTPSGIDNTVITYAKPVFFVKGRPPEILNVKRPFTLVIGDTGVQSSTADVVGGVRAAWEKDRQTYERLFDSIGTVATSAREAIESGEVNALGPLMDENHSLLQSLGVSSPELEALVVAARSAGAKGAKLSGAGGGGNMIALAGKEDANEIAKALILAGAAQAIVTEIN